MYITSSAVSMESSRRYTEQTAKTTSGVSKRFTITAASVDETQAVDGNESDNSKNPFSETFTNLKNRYDGTASMRITRVQDKMQMLDRLRHQLLDYLLNILLGRDLSEENLTEYSDSEQADALLSEKSVGRRRVGSPWTQATNSASLTQNVSVRTTPNDNRYVTSYYQTEQETTALDTRASVRTADGRCIDINLTMELSRSFVQETQDFIDYSAPVVCDPLVINLNTPSAQVSDQKFFFDLDADGKEEEISMVQGGSGFLALDKNGDGVINDGSELFGALTGNGFTELAKYDSDGNGWIDEADEIFEKLRIWTKDANGNDVLCGLGKAGVGAIYLGCSPTEFSLKNMTTNETNAVIRQTGIFLYEKGMAGTIQQVDFAK